MLLPETRFFLDGGQGIGVQQKISSVQANGGTGGHFAFGIKPPGGLSVHFPPVESGRTPHSVSLRGPRLIKPPRSPQKATPCGMTAARAAGASHGQADQSQPLLCESCSARLDRRNRPSMTSGSGCSRNRISYMASQIGMETCCPAVSAWTALVAK